MDPPRLAEVVFTDIYALYQHIRHIDDQPNRDQRNDQRKQYLRVFAKKLLLVSKETHQHTLPLAILDQELQKYQECVAIHKK